MTKPPLFLSLLLTAVTLLPLAASAAWPERPITLVVPFPAGGPTDNIARLLADGLRKELKVPVVIDNKGGNGGNIGLDHAASAKPDGYTVLMVTQALVTFNPHLYKKMRVDPRVDMLPVANAFEADMILVGRKGAFKDLTSVVAKAKASPDSLTYGSAGNGSASHILAELFRSQAKVAIRHIPYKGTGPAMSDLVAGRIDLMVDSVQSTSAFIESKQIEAISLCGPVRNTQFPDVPTFRESGFPDFVAVAWFGTMVPKGTPPLIIEALGAATKSALANSELVKRATGASIRVRYQSASEMARTISADSELWGATIKSANIQLE